MLCGADKLTHFRCLGGWLRPSRFSLLVLTPDPYAGQFVGALSMFLEH